jgi:hypothetical protein
MLKATSVFHLPLALQAWEADKRCPAISTSKFKCGLLLGQVFAPRTTPLLIFACQGMITPIAFIAAVETPQMPRRSHEGGIRL